MAWLYPAETFHKARQVHGYSDCPLPVLFYRRCNTDWRSIPEKEHNLHWFSVHCRSLGACQPTVRRQETHRRLPNGDTRNPAWLLARVGPESAVALRRSIACAIRPCKQQGEKNQTDACRHPGLFPCWPRSCRCVPEESPILCIAKV